MALALLLTRVADTVWSILPYWITLAAVSNGITHKNGVQEYCQPEVFEATCGNGQVILMESARYGRMQVGRCVKQDYGHVGCSMDALSYMDSACSGAKTCQFRIYDSKLRQTLNPCPEDIASYLEASYMCQDVTTAQRAQCDVMKYLKVTRSTGLLASIEAEENGFGTVQCPWILHGNPGQTIMLSLLNFAQRPEHVAHKSGCYELAVIYEGSESRSITTCDGQRQESLVYQAISNEVRIQMVSKSALKTLGKFLIKYKVSGCSNIRAPANATLQREDDNLVVKCNNSDQTWYLVCKGNKWLGELGNCSAAEIGKQWKLGQIFSNDSFPYGILIVVAIGVALGVFCGGILLTCAAMYMKRRRKEPRDVVHYSEEQERFATMERARHQDLLFHETTDGKNVVVYPGKEIKCIDGSCLQNLDNEKQICGTYGRTQSIPSGTGTFPPRHHLYETPRFV